MVVYSSHAISFYLFSKVILSDELYYPAKKLKTTESDEKSANSPLNYTSHWESVKHSCSFRKKNLLLCTTLFLSVIKLTVTLSI